MSPTATCPDVPVAPPEVDQPLDATSVRRLCQFLESLHPNDRTAVTVHLAATILAASQRAIPISSADGAVLGYLLSLGEYVELTASPEERDQLETAVRKVADYLKSA